MLGMVHTVKSTNRPTLKSDPGTLNGTGLQNLKERRTALKGILIRSSTEKRIEAEAVTLKCLNQSDVRAEAPTPICLTRRSRMPDPKNFDQLFLDWKETKARLEKAEETNADLMKLFSKMQKDHLASTTLSNEFQQRLTEQVQSMRNELNEKQKQIDFENLKRSAQLDTKIKEIADANTTVETTLISAGDRVFEKVNGATSEFADVVTRGAKSVAATTKAAEAQIQSAGKDAAGAIRRAMNGMGFRVTLISLLVVFVGLSAWNAWTQAQILEQAKSASTGVFQIWKVQGIGPKYEAIKQAEADAAAAAKETK